MSLFTRTVYRIENPLTQVGLWYRADGAQVDFIKTIEDAKCRDLPMGFDPNLVGGWVSGTHSIEAMADWLTASDAEQLIAAGHGLYEVTVDERGFRMTREPYVHAVFRREHVRATRQLPYTVLGLS